MTMDEIRADDMVGTEQDAQVGRTDRARACCQVIDKEGVESLSVVELQAACRERGMRAIGISRSGLEARLQVPASPAPFALPTCLAPGENAPPTLTRHALFSTSNGSTCTSSTTCPSPCCS
jgi:hypothetical protein